MNLARDGKLGDSNPGGDTDAVIKLRAMHKAAGKKAFSKGKEVNKM